MLVEPFSRVALTGGKMGVGSNLAKRELPAPNGMDIGACLLLLAAAVQLGGNLDALLRRGERPAGFDAQALRDGVDSSVLA